MLDPVPVAEDREQESLKYLSIYLAEVSVRLTVDGLCASKTTSVSSVCRWGVRETRFWNLCPGNAVGLRGN